MSDSKRKKLSHKEIPAVPRAFRPRSARRSSPPYPFHPITLVSHHECFRKLLLPIYSADIAAVFFSALSLFTELKSLRTDPINRTSLLISSDFTYFLPLYCSYPVS